MCPAATRAPTPRPSPPTPRQCTSCRPRALRSPRTCSTSSALTAWARLKVGGSAPAAPAGRWRSQRRCAARGRGGRRQGDARPTTLCPIADAVQAVNPNDTSTVQAVKDRPLEAFSSLFQVRRFACPALHARTPAGLTWRGTAHAGRHPNPRRGCHRNRKLQRQHQQQRQRLHGHRPQRRHHLRPAQGAGRRRGGVRGGAGRAGCLTLGTPLQAWSNCNDNWMLAGNLCRASCGRCTLPSPQSSSASAGSGASSGACTDEQPDSVSCQQQKQYGKCSEAWFISNNYCAATCGRCTSGSNPSPPSSPAPAGGCSDAQPSDGTTCQLRQVRAALVTSALVTCPPARARPPASPVHTQPPLPPLAAGLGPLLAGVVQDHRALPENVWLLLQRLPQQPQPQPLRLRRLHRQAARRLLLPAAKGLWQVHRGMVCQRQLLRSDLWALRRRRRRRPRRGCLQLR